MPKRKINVRSVTEADSVIGEKIRARRLLIGISQSELASKLGVTFQQVQKYERGASRVSATRLHAISVFLNVPLMYFYDSMDQNNNEKDNLENAFGISSDVIFSEETLSLIRNYYSIHNIDKRKKVHKIIIDIIKSYN